MLKLQRTSTKILLAVLGAGYLASISSLDINVFIRPYAAIAPIQLLTLIYVIYLIFASRVSGR
ncbi:MAG: hypothetical protein AAFQ41_14655 [Cyanobacteria bacterium J06623_7]